MRVKLKRDIKFREVSHGHEEHPNGDKLIRAGTWVDYVGPSKAPGHTVIKHNGTYIRIKPL